MLFAQVRGPGSRGAELRDGCLAVACQFQEVGAAADIQPPRFAGWLINLTAN